MLANFKSKLENVDRQRGKNTFIRSIESPKILNKLGYGTDFHFGLSLVYNPGGDYFLPGSQRQLESDYKKELHDKYGIRFNNLFTITNPPIGRFRKYLKANGKLKEYLQLLVEKFNPAAAKNIMCRTLLSVNYRGIAYNCGFNQALNLPIRNGMRKPVTIKQLNSVLQGNIEITTDEHCFCFISGAGSSCTGSLAD